MLNGKSWLQKYPNKCTNLDVALLVGLQTITKFVMTLYNSHKLYQAMISSKP